MNMLQTTIQLSGVTQSHLYINQNEEMNETNLGLYYNILNNKLLQITQLQ